MWSYKKIFYKGQHKRGNASKNKQITLKDNTDQLVELFSKTRRYVNHVYEGFYQNKIRLLEEAESEFSGLKREVTILMNQLIETKAKDKEEDKTIKSMISITSHLERIEENIVVLISTTKSMIKEGLLFTNKAIRDISHLYEAFYDILGDAADSIITKNDTLINHIIKNIDLSRKDAGQYATEHEERLISGVCSPKSASLYLKMLDSIAEAMRHTKKIVQAL
jgi:Na+/phosphate symporter